MKKHALPTIIKGHSPMDDYRKHPYTNEGITWNEEDDSGRIYYYCQRDIRDKVMWYENMYGRELLLQALNELKQD